MQSIPLKRQSISYICSSSLFVTLFTAPSFSVRKFVFTIIQPLALVQGKKVAEPKAKAAFDAAEHARPQASAYHYE